MFNAMFYYTCNYQIATLVRGENWSPNTSTAKDFQPSTYSANQQEYPSYQSDLSSSYQNSNSGALKTQTEAFFVRKQSENANRPEWARIFVRAITLFALIASRITCVDEYFYRNLPPSQGGKYGGFGYQMEQPSRSSSQEFFDTAVSSLASVK